MSDQTTYEQLAALRRWAKYGRLLSGVIHNLNTPLMGITGRVELIGFKMPDLKGLDQITKQLQRINEILVPLASLIDKDQNIERGITDVNDLVQKVDKLLYADMKYKHRLNAELDLNGTLFADIVPSALQNALFEVCMNAVDALPHDANLLLSTNREGDEIIIRVTNDGPPIPQDVLPHLGEPGLTGKAGHLGLGCYIARQGTDICRGQITWQNTDPGVCCTIKLPVATSKNK